MNRRTLLPLAIGHVIPGQRNMHLDFISRARFENEPPNNNNGGGGEEPSEFEKTPIPETFKDSPIGKYKTVGEVIKGYGEAQKLIGAKGVILPGEKADQAEIDRFYNAIGRPEKPEAYKLTPIEGLHPEVKLTPEAETGFKALMHKHGLTAKQADGIFKDFFTMVSGSLVKRDESSRAAAHNAEKELRAAWGQDYDKHLSSAKRLIEKFGGAGARDAFGDLGNNPQVLKTLALIASKFSEDGFIKGPTVTNEEIKSAKQKLNDIMLNKEHAYWKQGPGHQEALDEVARLNAIIYPEVEA